jgi:hypothetical protein
LLKSEDPDDFEIVVDQDLIMNWAGVRADNFAYHGSNYGWLNVNVPSDSTYASITDISQKI